MDSAEGLIISALVVFSVLVMSGSGFSSSPEKEPEAMNRSEITTSWNLSSLFQDREAASEEYKRLEDLSKEISVTFRPRFQNLTGPVLLEYIEADKNFSKRLNVIYAYVSAQNSLNVNEEFYETLLSDLQNLSTDHYKAVSYAEIKLKSLSSSEWDRIFSEELGLEKYRAYLENSYRRYANHRPRDESHAAYLADISNQLMKIDTEAEKLVTNNVTVAGNITLENGKELALNSETYTELMSTDANRNNRKKAYDKRFDHLIEESDRMAEIY